ncbi:MAG: hypothetical protein KIT43_06010 [Bauldia sp.]|nr:hypothetical protein [Bauldia sp.]
MAKAPTTELSPKDELAQLEKRREELRARLREEHEGALQQSLRDFNGMNFGVTYELREVGLPRGARQIMGSGDVRKGTRTVNAERACPICNFKTVPPHDARAHRSQATKSAFTAEELAGRGMRKG